MLSLFSIRTDISVPCAYKMTPLLHIVELINNAFIEWMINDNVLSKYVNPYMYTVAYIDYRLSLDTDTVHTCQNDMINFQKCRVIQGVPEQ